MLQGSVTFEKEIKDILNSSRFCVLSGTSTCSYFCCTPEDSTRKLEGGGVILW